MFSISYTTGFHRDLQVLNMFFYMFSWLGLAYLGEVYIKLYSETFSLILSIVLMAVAANLISGWIKQYKWIAWIGLLAILVVAVELIYTDIKTLLLLNGRLK